MKETKSTRNALICSVLVLVLTVSMLVGTTFAWFTDSATTSVNTIQAGGLKVDLVGQDNNTLVGEGKSLHWMKDGAANDNIRWKPGDKYELQPFKVVNKGDLALEYRIAVTGLNGDSELNDVIKWYYSINNGGDIPLSRGDSIPGDVLSGSNDVVSGKNTESPLITIKAEMALDARNYYQGMALNGVGVTVDAIQYTEGENASSFKRTVSNESQLRTALDNGVTEITLNGDVTLTQELEIKKNVTINGGGKTITGKPVKLGTDVLVNFDNVKFGGIEGGAENASVYSNDFSGEVTFNACAFDDSNKDTVRIKRVGDSVIKFENCQFTAQSGKSQFINIYADSVTLRSDVTLSVCTFNDCDNLEQDTDNKVRVLMIQKLPSGSKLVLGKCSFSGSTERKAVVKDASDKNVSSVMEMLTGENLTTYTFP